MTMAPTRRSTARAAPAELSMQQVLEIMRGLQQDMADSKMEQERMQADLDASHERNEELHRVNEELRLGLRNDQRQPGHDEMENHSPPREFSTPFRTVIQETLKAPRRFVEDNRVGVLQIHTSRGGPRSHCSLTQDT